jgi:hypothetical protein
MTSFAARPVRLSLAALFIATGANVQAQLPVPTRADGRALESLRSMTRCLAGALPDEIDLYLRAAPGSSKAERWEKHLRRSANFCFANFGSTMRIKPPVFRGALAEALYLQSFEPVSADESRPQATAANAPASLDQLAACVAAAEPGSADALLRTAWASTGEAEALVALKNGIVRCSGPRPAPLAPSALRFRGVLAEALYKLRKASAGARSSSRDAT